MPYRACGNPSHRERIDYSSRTFVTHRFAPAEFAPALNASTFCPCFAITYASPSWSAK